MTPQQETLIRETWRQVTPIAEAAAEMFYNRLFEIAPAAGGLFHATDMARQRRALVEALTFVVDELGKPEALLPVLHDLGRRHAAYGLRDAHFEAVGAALLWTLAQGLGPNWSPKAEAAWSEAYGLVADAMREGARESTAAPLPN
ncbi:globin family protein [Pelagibius marinus]|uniref:globin family protein n=1 Tax=Pelagibius marinus TaxID=2762760 RepID=UPI001872BA72|nr:globin family protein [Pelagibius marinus]